MAYVAFNDLTAAQRIEAVALRPKWHLTEFKNFAFWVRASGHISRRAGHHELLEGAYQAIISRYAHRPNAEKGDLDAWKPGVTFHLSRD